MEINIVSFCSMRIKLIWFELNEKFWLEGFKTCEIMTRLKRMHVQLMLVTKWQIVYLAHLLLFSRQMLKPTDTRTALQCISSSVYSLCSLYPVQLGFAKAIFANLFISTT